MEYKKILVLSDNKTLYMGIKSIFQQKYNDFHFQKVEFKCSHNNKHFIEEVGEEVKPINVKEECEEIIKDYDLVISAHCKQLFPKKLTDSITCINIHPGLNPYNRGWYPQVFSILNGLPVGATIHIIDEEIDHGPIIDQEKVDINLWDTSLSVYNRIMDLELKLFDKNINSIINGNYQTRISEYDGNLNLKNDFSKLLNIDINSEDKFINHINILRALTHGEYKNCYFYDEYGKKIFIRIILEKEEDGK